MIRFKNNAAEVRYDFCAWNDVDDRVEFYYDDELVAWVRAESYRIYGKAANEEAGPAFRIVSVKFGESGRIYDYLCDIEDVQPGDRVVVDGYDGETEVTVTSVMTKRESELGLPASRYKRILRKA